VTKIDDGVLVSTVEREERWHSQRRKNREDGDGWNESSAKVNSGRGDGGDPTRWIAFETWGGSARKAGTI